MGIEKVGSKMRDLYRSIEVGLDKVDFNNIWPGFFRMEFAIYNKDRVFLKDEEIPYDERFLGNTSIDYNGRRLAIWYVEESDKEDSRELASNIVHEMFHSHQMSNNEIRFPNDLKGLDYPMDLKNYEIKHRENKLLVKALDTDDINIKLDMLKEIISLRRVRLQDYGDIIKYEFAIETVEGSAEYCGAKALKDISEELYEKRIEGYKKILTNNIPMLFDIRRTSYYTGTLLLLLLEELDISFTREILGQSKYIFEEAADKFEHDVINIEDIHEPKIEEYFIEHVNKTDRKFEEFFNQSVEKHEGDFMICGYDPMNMIKKEEQILCSHIIMLLDKVSNEQLLIKGPVVVKLEKGTYNQVIEYYSKI